MSRRTKCEPMKPAPPVTSTFTARRLVVDDEPAHGNAVDLARCGRLGGVLGRRPVVARVDRDDDLVGGEGRQRVPDRKSDVCLARARLDRLAGKRLRGTLRLLLRASERLLVVG